MSDFNFKVMNTLGEWYRKETISTFVDELSSVGFLNLETKECLYATFMRGPVMTLLKQSRCHFCPYEYYHTSTEEGVSRHCSALFRGGWFK